MNSSGFAVAKLSESGHFSEPWPYLVQQFSVCFLRGRRSCPLAGLWGGDELESLQCGSLKQAVSVMGMGARCMGMSLTGSCCAPGGAWLETVCGWVPFAEDEDRHFKGDLTGEGGSMSS